MQPSVKPFSHRVGKDFFHPFITLVVWPQSISMTDKKFFVVVGKYFSVMINGNIELFFKIISHPQIVISDKEINRNSTIANFCKFSQNAYKSFWHHLFIFEPKIK